MSTLVAEAESPQNILEVNNLKVHFPITTGFLRKTTGHVKAVDDVSFTVIEGETLGIVGESGCGKTTTGRAIMRAVEPTSGNVMFKKRDGDVVNITNLASSDLKNVREEMQIVFQDPFASLNPRMTVFDIVADPLRVNNVAKGQELEDIVSNLLRTVGLVQHISNLILRIQGNVYYYVARPVGKFLGPAPRPQCIFL